MQRSVDIILGEFLRPQRETIQYRGVQSQVELGEDGLYACEHGVPTYHQFSVPDMRPFVV